MIGMHRFEKVVVTLMVSVGVAFSVCACGTVESQKESTSANMQTVVSDSQQTVVNDSQAVEGSTVLKGGRAQIQAAQDYWNSEEGQAQIQAAQDYWNSEAGQAQIQATQDYWNSEAGQAQVQAAMDYWNS